MANFDINEAKRAGYSNEEIAAFLADKSGLNITKAKKAGYTSKDIIPWAIKNIARPTLEFGGMTAGALIGGGLGAPTGVGALATGAAGAGLGYGIGRQAAGRLEEMAGIQEPQPLPQQALGAVEDVATGAAMHGGGLAIGKGAGLAAKGIKQAWGSLTGTGSAAIEKAVMGHPGFKAALRGKIPGEQIVHEAREALNVLKSQRAAAYQKDLADLAQLQGRIDIKPLQDKTMDVLKRFVRVDKSTGTPDWSRSALGPEKSEGVRKIKQIVDTIKKWGTKEGDDTVAGLDMLKRQLDDFYSESSNARAFVSTMRNEVKKQLVKEVPEYATMTKKYMEATNLIKDIEQGLMLRKHAMTGRMTADMTLRRLTSTMKDNFELRRELVEILGDKAATDITDKVAGHAMSSMIPRGITGSGLGLGMGAYAVYVNPKFWPVLAASSPRVSAEFLMIFGKGLKETAWAGPHIARYLAYKAGGSKPVADNN